MRRTFKSNRFVLRYQRRRMERHSPVERVLRIISGVLLIIGGVLIGWLPGPGFIVLALPGAFLLASEVRRAAIIFDHVENETIPRLQRLYARIWKGPKREWIERDPALWADWYDRRGRNNPDTGDRRRADDETTTGEPEGPPV